MFFIAVAHVLLVYLALVKIESGDAYMDRVKRIWYLSHMRAAKVQASLHIRAVSPEPSLLAHTSSESRGTFRQKTRSLAPLNVWACAVTICHDGMLEDTNSLDGAHIINVYLSTLVMHINYIFISSYIHHSRYKLPQTRRHRHSRHVTDCDDNDKWQWRPIYTIWYIYFQVHSSQQI